MATIKTTLHVFHFDTRKPEEAKAWAELRAKLSEGPHRMKALGSGYYVGFTSLDGATVDLETEHLFDNQWNTAPLPGKASGLRVFDWAQDYLPSDYSGARHIKRGHYLVQTEEMRELRRNTDACGYCGKQEPAAKGYVFCPHCIDSEYLTADSLHLTRMQPVADTSSRAELSEAERAHLLPLFHNAQVHGATKRGKARIAKTRERVEAKYKKAIYNANAEHDAALWLMVNAPGMLENWIFYTHTSRHCFGWRKKLDAGTLSALLDVITEFPFPYDIQCADGRTLSGER